jgi:hypothetical protein
MRRRDALKSMALAPLAGQLPKAGPGPANAVDLYREAFEKLPTPSEVEKALLEDVAVAPLDRAASDLAERCAPALALLIRGASAPSCDWGDALIDDFDTFVIDAVMKGRRLARLGSLRARIAIEAGRSAEGIDDAIATMTLGRHFVKGAVLIAQLIGRAIEISTIEAVAVSILKLDLASLGSLEARFLALPLGVDVPTTVRAEKAYFLGYYAPRHREELDAAKVEQWKGWYDRLAAACDDPAALDAMRAEAKPDAEKTQFFESLDGHRRARTIGDVKRALFRAGIAVAQDGPGAVGRVVDPTDGRPFDLRTWATGFELMSRFALYGKPNAALLIGKRS